MCKRIRKCLVRTNNIHNISKFKTKQQYNLNDNHSHQQKKNDNKTAKENTSVINS